MNQKGAMVEGRAIHKHVKKIVFLKYSISKATVKYTYIYIYIYKLQTRFRLMLLATKNKDFLLQKS